ncbi:hypothetical protein F5B22DRAFT_524501 [Xylaria bambusicola]|uniref:uncharacterized protein n=1 Tax=Xylaria bambusicola TaxID=326684 RepID=UPI002008A8A7|nr:uncharacterized protein F5B22DRAFT_524501 [Xylaria bambusicola]KAI0505440.1 hypothetical protein F5B22DRAFT_524501 [Xylaria bambusicola]
MGRLPTYFRRDDAVSHPTTESTPKSSEITTENTIPVDPWMIVVIVAGILIVVTLAIVMCMHFFKSRRARKTTGFQPVKEEEKNSTYPPKRRSGRADRQTLEDQERDLMIRKSLASRSSLAASDPISQIPSPEEQQHSGDYHPEVVSPEEPSRREYHLAHPLGDESERTSLREDWKAWEARVQTERRSSNPGGVGHDQHPAFASYLSVPQPTRMASPVRGGPSVYRHI